MAARRVLGDVPLTNNDQPRMAKVKPNWATSAAAVNCTPLASNPSAEEEPPVLTRYNNSHPCWTFQAFRKLSASLRLTQHAVPSALPQLHPLCCLRYRLPGLANCSFWSWEYR